MVELPGVSQDPDIVVGDGNHEQVHEVINGLTLENLETDLGANEGIVPAGEIGPGNQNRFMLSPAVKTHRDRAAS